MKKTPMLILMLLLAQTDAQNPLGNKTFDITTWHNDDGTITVNYIEHDTGKVLKSYTYDPQPIHPTQTTLQKQQPIKLDTQTTIAIIFAVVTLIIIILWKLGKPEVNQKNE